MRIRDWSSDVCSSDLHAERLILDFGARTEQLERHRCLTAFRSHPRCHVLARTHQQLYWQKDFRQQTPVAATRAEVLHDGVEQRLAMTEQHRRRAIETVDRKSTRLNSSH